MYNHPSVLNFLMQECHANLLKLTASLYSPLQKKSLKFTEALSKQRNCNGHHTCTNTNKRDEAVQAGMKADQIRRIYTDMNTYIYF